MLSLLILFVAIIIIWLSFFFNANYYKSQLAQALSHNDNVQVIIKGTLKFDLWTMSLTANDVRINSTKAAVNTSWQQARITTNPITLLFDKELKLNQLTLSNGVIYNQSQHSLPVTRLDITQHDSESFLIKADISQQNFQANIKANLISEHGTTNVKQLYIKGSYKNKPFSLQIPQFKIYQQSTTLITNASLRINQQQGLINTQRIDIEPFKLTGTLNFKQLHLDQLVDLKGFKLKLNNSSLVFALQENAQQQAIDGTITIHANSALLEGINLNHIAKNITNLLSALGQGQGIGSAFQSIKKTLSPLLNDHKLKVNLAQKTHFNKLTINNALNNKRLITTNFSWLANEFSIQGKGEYHFDKHQAFYPLMIDINSQPVIKIPYDIRIQNQKASGNINQSQLQKNLQPIIENILSNTLNNKLNALFK